MAGSIPDVVVAHILAAYPLVRPTVVRPLDASTRNDNWLVEDAAGRRYVLRRHRQHAHVQRIAFQLRFQEHLLHHGFPTAEVVRPRAGRSFVLADDGIPWALFTYIAGEHYDFGSMGHVVEAARRLAQFHAVAATFPGDSVVVEYDPPIRDWWVHCAENLQALEELYAGGAVDDELADVRAWWRWVLSEWPLARLDGLPVGWVHGDYHGRNIVFRGADMYGLFDFDDLNRGPLVYDVARGVRMFGREQRGSHHIRLEVARLFVGEYTRHRALTWEERAALPMMVALCYPPQARYHRYCQQRHGEDIVARLRREVSTMRALRAEMARIGALLTQGSPPETD